MTHKSGVFGSPSNETGLLFTENAVMEFSVSVPDPDRDSD
jgi:hypothetical protein